MKKLEWVKTDTKLTDELHIDDVYYFVEKELGYSWFTDLQVVNWLRDNKTTFPDVWNRAQRQAKPGDRHHFFELLKMAREYAHSVIQNTYPELREACQTINKTFRFGSEFELTFGSHKGKKLKQIPSDTLLHMYLEARGNQCVKQQIKNYFWQLTQ